MSVISYRLLELDGNYWNHRQYNPLRNCTRGSGWRLYNQRWMHKYRGKDQYISDWCRPYLTDSLSWVHILADSWAQNQSSQTHIHIELDQKRLDIASLVRMVMACKGWVVWVVMCLLPLQGLVPVLQMLNWLGYSQTCNTVRLLDSLVESCLLGIMWQPVRGSPVHPEGHTQIGLWLTTRHWASRPQVPGQGSWHLKLTHAWDGAHSELDTHSGLHSGGTPK
jgi:hypothetical protein